MSRTDSQSGFTLIELMIVVVILGIITTIAVQSYSGATRDGERAKIISEMNALNDAIGRFYQGSYSYQGVENGSGVPTTAVRGGIATSPNYTVRITHPGGNYQLYYLIARPVAGGVMAGDGTYSIQENGQHCFFPGNDAADPAGGTCPRTW